MKTIDIVQPSADVSGLLEKAKSDDLIVRLPDGSEFMLVAIDDFDREVARARQNPKLMALLEARAKQEQTLSSAEVKRRLGIGT